MHRLHNVYMDIIKTCHNQFFPLLFITFESKLGNFFEMCLRADSSDFSLRNDGLCDESVNIWRKTNREVNVTKYL